MAFGGRGIESCRESASSRAARDELAGHGGVRVRRNRGRWLGRGLPPPEKGFPVSSCGHVDPWVGSTGDVVLGHWVAGVTRGWYEWVSVVTLHSLLEGH